MSQCPPDKGPTFSPIYMRRKEERGEGQKRREEERGKEKERRREGRRRRRGEGEKVR